MANSLEQDRLLSPSECARYLGLSLSTVYSKSCRRQLPFVKVGRALRFQKSALDKLIKAGERPALRPISDTLGGTATGRDGQGAI
jgi:excisionase family DNA binding protein